MRYELARSGLWQQPPSFIADGADRIDAEGVKVAEVNRGRQRSAASELQ